MTAATFGTSQRGLDLGKRLKGERASLGHASIRMTENHYAPSVKAREIQLEEEIVAAMRKMGAIVTV